MVFGRVIEESWEERLARLGADLQSRPEVRVYPGLEYASVNHRRFAEMLDRMGLSVSAVDAEVGRKVLARSVALVQDYRATSEEAWQLSFIDRYTVEGGTVRYGTVRYGRRW